MSPFFNITYAKKACNATGKATPATLRRQNILYRIVHGFTILSHNTSGLHLKVASPSSIDLVKRSGCNHKAFDCSRALQILLSERSLLSLLSQYFHCALVAASPTSSYLIAKVPTSVHVQTHQSEPVLSTSNNAPFSWNSWFSLESTSLKSWMGSCIKSAARP